MPIVTAAPLAVTGEQRAVLERMGRSTSLPHRRVIQAEALLLAADGVVTNEVARRMRHDGRERAGVATPFRGGGCGRGGEDRAGPGPQVVAGGGDGG